MLLFLAVSTLLIHSAVQNQRPIFQTSDTKNIINYAIGFVAMFAAMFFNYRWLVKLAPYLYAAGVISLIAVLKFGKTINNASGWFEVGGFLIQPAELVKLLIILMIAFWISRRKGEQLRFWKDVIPIGVIVLIPFTLVMMQPDLGNAIIYLIILLGMLWIGNVKYLHVFIGTLLIVGSMIGLYSVYTTNHDEITSFLKKNDMGHWAQRIDAFLDPDSVSDDAKRQAVNSKIAIGSGGLSGEGFKQGEYVNNGFIPYTYSDSIFVVVAEELGFVGSSALLLMYFLLIYRLIWTAIQCDQLSGCFIIVGIVSMFVFQIFENIGMLIGIMPLTGITLPFISYGGSSLLINMTSLGVVMSTRLYQEKKQERY